MSANAIVETTNDIVELFSSSNFVKKLKAKFSSKSPRPENFAINQLKNPKTATKLCPTCKKTSEDVKTYCPNCGALYGF